MTLAVRGSLAAFRSSTPLTLTLPGSALAGDWLIALAGGGGNGFSLSGVGSGWTELVPSTLIGTGCAWVGIRQLTPTDIATGSVAIASSANQNCEGAIVVFSGCAGFGVPGTVTKRSGTQGTTLAVAAGTNGQFVLVIQIEKSTNNSAISGVVPTTSLIVQGLPNGTSMPSVWVGSYVVAGSPADRTITNSVMSANALGLQIPVLESATPPAGIATTYYDGATEKPVTLQGIWDGSAVQPLTLDQYI